MTARRPKTSTGALSKRLAGAARRSPGPEVIGVITFGRIEGHLRPLVVSYDPERHGLVKSVSAAEGLIIRALRPKAPDARDEKRSSHGLPTLSTGGKG